jgi:hypothetical protein
MRMPLVTDPQVRCFLKMPPKATAPATVEVINYGPLLATEIYQIKLAKIRNPLKTIIDCDISVKIT